MAGLRKVEECRKAIDKGVEYILSHLGEKGVEQPEAVSPAALHKLPLALILAGRKREGVQLLNWIKGEMLSDNTLIVSPRPIEAEKKEGEEPEQPKTPERWPNQMAAWIAVAAHTAGRFDISMTLAGGLRECLGPICGGVYEGREPAQRNMHHIVTTAACGLAFLHCGFIEEARRTGTFLAGVPAKQPKGRMFYASFDMAGRPVKDHPAPEPATGEDPLSPQLFRSRKGQQYEIIGMPELLLAKLHQATGEPDFLAGARAYGHIGHHLQADAWRSVSGWAGAWAEAIMLSLTARQRYLQFVQRMANYLSGEQHESGTWLREKDFSKIDAQPEAVSLDAAASGVIALIECVTEAQ